MTRKEEIKQAGINYTLANKPRCIAGDNFADVRDVFNRNLDFEAGAKWADEHPKQIEISLEDIEELAKEVIPDDWVKRQDTLWEIIRRNQRAQFIDKACAWLKDYAHIFVSETTGDLNEDELISAFRKDMKGDMI